MSKQSHNAGFSLVEMAVVLAIVALLLGGLLPMISGQMEQQHRSETRKQLNEISSALVGFAVTNGRLPCPDTNNDGTEDFSATALTINNIPNTGQSTQILAPCNGGGTVPYNQLGTPQTDGFGGTFMYNVSPVFAGKNVKRWGGTGASGTLLSTDTNGRFLLTDTGTMDVCLGTNNKDTTPCPTPRLVDNAVAVVLSRGPDWARPPSIEETENTDNDTDFISHDYSPAFDDLVTWLSPNILFNRLVAAGKLP
ncbi:MAG: type II secretion system protein [Sideroxydans sp.]|nr:type II secretion system protein [Sideroxydans sp.]